MRRRFHLSGCSIVLAALLACRRVVMASGGTDRSRFARLAFAWWATAVTALSLSCAPAALAQDGLGFRFVRIQYDMQPYARAATWAYDYPTAEQNLHTAIDRLTALHVDGHPLVLRLEDESIFNYPILYLTEPGYWRTNDEEVRNLQEYFRRGGFLIIDDFHDWPGGSRREWDNFYTNIKRVFPDREPVELPPDHPIWTVYYDIDPVAAASTKRGFGRDLDRYYGIYADDGRLLVVVCYNQDIGDGWEWPDQNFSEESTVSFQMAINFILFALTH